MALDESKNPADNIDEAYGITIITDPKFSEFLEGAVINYIESEYSSGFQITSAYRSDGCSGCNSDGCGS